MKQPSSALRELQQAAAKSSQGANARLQPAAAASGSSNTAEKPLGPLPDASQAKQPQHAAKNGQPSKQVAKGSDKQTSSKASEAPSSSAPSSSAAAKPKPAAAEQRPAAIKAAPEESSSQPSKASSKEPVASGEVSSCMSGVYAVQPPHPHSGQDVKALHVLVLLTSTVMGAASRPHSAVPWAPCSVCHRQC